MLRIPALIFLALSSALACEAQSPATSPHVGGPKAQVAVEPTSLTIAGEIGQASTEHLTIRNAGVDRVAWSLNPPGPVLKKISLRKRPRMGILFGVAWDGKSLWLSDGKGAIFKIDPENGALLGELRPGVKVQGLDWDGTYLWGLSHTADPDDDVNWLHAIDRETGRVIKTLKGPRDHDLVEGGVVAGDGHLWVLGSKNIRKRGTPGPIIMPLNRPGHAGNHKVWKVDPATETVVSSWDLPPQEAPATSGNEPKGAIEYVNGAIWMGQWWHKVSRDKTPNVSWMTLYKLDARNGQVQETLRLGEHKDLRTREDRPDDIGAGIFSWLNDLAKTGTRAVWLLVHCELGDDFQELYLYDTGNEPWMQADSRSGVLAPGETKVVKLSFDAVAAGIGTHQTVLRIVQGGVDKAEVLVPVRFTAKPAAGNHPPIIAEGDSTSLTMVEDGPTVRVTLHAADADEDTLTWRLAVAPRHGWAWVFGQGAKRSIEYTPAPDHSGTDRFVVEVADGKGGADTIEVRASIQGVNDAPRVTIAQSTAIGTAPLDVAFTAKGSDPDGDRLVYAWDFGDGQYSTEQAPTHTYAKPGTYRASVAVSDPSGLRADASAAITVWAAADAGGAVVLAWGENGSGQLGDGTADDRAAAARVALLEGITEIAAGYAHTVVLRRDRTVFAWGANGAGQLGDATDGPRASPMQVTSLAGATAIAAAGDHTVAIKEDGTVWTCGNNASGQLGDGTRTSRPSPVQTRLPDGTALADIVAVAAGAEYTLALKRDGTVWAWGNNTHGQVGDGTTVSRLHPVQVRSAGAAPLAGVVGIAAGHAHAAAVLRDGKVVEWGHAAFGQLFPRQGVIRRNPVPVNMPDGAPLDDAIALAAGYSHTVALKRNGTVWTWGGHNPQAPLLPGPADRLLPAQVKLAAGQPLADITAIAAGPARTIAVKRDGTVWAWGTNKHGSLGDGTTTDRPHPVQVKSQDGVAIMGVARVAVGMSHSLALLPREAAGRSKP